MDSGLTGSQVGANMKGKTFVFNGTGASLVKSNGGTDTFTLLLRGVRPPGHAPVCAHVALSIPAGSDSGTVCDPSKGDGT